MRRPQGKGVNSGLTKCKGNTHICNDKWERQSNKDMTSNKPCIVKCTHICVYT